MPGHKHQRDEALLLALASGQTAVEAAKAAGVSESTVGRRLKNRAFRRRLWDLRCQVVKDASARLAALMTKAADKLGTLLDSATEQSVLQAARVVLGQGRSLYETALLQERIEELTALEDLLRRKRPEWFRGCGPGSEREPQPCRSRR
jgi:transposase